MSWLNELTKQHSEFESPLSFWWWGGVATISAVVKDKVWMDRYIYKLYPNVYIMLHADSGLKKGPPISMAKKLVKPVGGINVITGRSSVQGILKEMGTARGGPGGRVTSNSNAFICSSELTSSIVDDPVATKILTDLYDRQYNEDEWKSLLKMEQFNLNNPTITMFTATNDSMSEDFFTVSAIKGGYIARTFVVYESARNRRNSLGYPPEYIPSYKNFSDYLIELSKLNGQFRAMASLTQGDEYQYKRIMNNREIWFSRAGMIYEDWYEEFLNIVDAMDVKDETGTMNRFGDSVLKVAMILSLAEHPKLVITESAMNIAISTCEKLLGNVRKATHGKQGISNVALLKNLIIDELFKRDKNLISREMLMKKMYTHYTDSTEFDGIMLSFDSAGLIKTESTGMGVMYRMPSDQVEELRRFFQGKQK